jgi:hypothetical protein
LGCNHAECHIYGVQTAPILKIRYSDLPAQNGRSPSRERRLKEEQKRQVERLRRPGLLSRFWRWLLNQIQIG